MKLTQEEREDLINKIENCFLGNVYSPNGIQEVRLNPEILKDTILSKIDTILEERREKVKAQAEFDADKKYEKALGVMIKRLGGNVSISDNELLEDIVVFQNKDIKDMKWNFKAVDNINLNK